MRQREDLRGTTGFLDWAAELTVDIDDIKDDANRAHDNASANYGLARSAESRAREGCTTALDEAYKALPDFRGGSFVDAKDLLSAMPVLRAEATEARADSLTRLEGSGAKAEFTKPVGKDDVSASLMDIRLKLRASATRSKRPFRIRGRTAEVLPLATARHAGPGECCPPGPASGRRRAAARRLGPSQSFELRRHHLFERRPVLIMHVRDVHPGQLPDQHLCKLRLPLGH
jgi:hypothetical protein